jgi:plasmid stabilization system protein ParE
VRFRVDITRAAQSEIGATYEYLQENVPEFADRWLIGVYDAIATLSELPHRCARAVESDGTRSEARQLLYRFSRILYEVRDRTVFVLHVHSDD